MGNCRDGKMLCGTLSWIRYIYMMSQDNVVGTLSFTSLGRKILVEITLQQRRRLHQVTPMVPHIVTSKSLHLNHYFRWKNVFVDGTLYKSM